MRTQILAAALCLAAIPNLSAKAADSGPPEGYLVSPINRATIFVRDQEKSLKLYRDILGMKIWVNNMWPAEGNGLNTIMNTKGLPLHAIILGSGDSVFGRLGIYQLSNETTKAPPPDQSTTTKTGDFAIVLMTRDIDDLVAKVKAAGYPIISMPTTIRDNPDYAVQGREMLFRDGDGVLVNLVQPAVPRKAN